VSNSASKKKKKKKGKIGELRGQSPGEEKLTAEEKIPNRGILATLGLVNYTPGMKILYNLTLTYDSNLLTYPPSLTIFPALRSLPPPSPYRVYPPINFNGSTIYRALPDDSRFSSLTPVHNRR
jgi:hypothetical protein